MYWIHDEAPKVQTFSANNTTKLSFQKNKQTVNYFNNASL